VYLDPLMHGGTLAIDRIRRELRTRRIGTRIEYFDTVSSTNDEAWSQLAGLNADGLVILAEQQRCGRGRHGRTWESPRGASVLCSVVLVEDENGRSRWRVSPIPIPRRHSSSST